MTGKRFRCWILGLSCSVMPFAGCAHSPQSPRGGLFAWFRSRPLTEQEQSQRERKEVSKELQDPGHLQLKYAQWRESVGDLADARQSYQFALKENPKSLEAKLGLARLDQLAGRTTEAETGFQNALKSRPHDPQAMNALGQFYASQKNWSKALPLLEEAADAAPNELTYRYHLAVATAQSGDIGGAFPHFQQALGEAEAHYNIGFLLAEQGHKDMARQRFQKALAINPNLTQAQMMLDELDPRMNDTQIAETTSPRWPAATPGIQQVSATEPAPHRIHVSAAQFPEPKTLPGIHPIGEAPRPMPSHPPVSQHAERTPNPPAFRETGASTMPKPKAELAVNPPAFRATANSPTAPEAKSAQPATNPPAFRATPAAKPAPEPKAEPLPNPPAFRETVPASTAPQPAPNPPAFRATRPKEWNATKSADEAPEYLPPYQPEAAAETNNGTKAATPPITPAQREQWENQMKANP